jgi:hypothetical protein
MQNAQRITWQFRLCCSKPWVRHLAHSNCGRGARVIVEKRFGRDLASARQLNRALVGAFDEADIFRIDHYLGKRAVNHVLAFRFANAFAEAFWNRNYSYFRFVLLFVRHGSGKDPREPTDGMSLIAAKIGGSTSVFIGIRGAV